MTTSQQQTKVNIPLSVNKRLSVAPTSMNRGFSLIEVMVTLVVLSIGILGMLKMQTTAIDTNAKALDNALAMEYATDIMEQLMIASVDVDDDGIIDTSNVANNDLNGDGTADFTDDLYYSNIFNMTWNATDFDCDGDGNNDAKRIDITITWNNGKRQVNMSGVKTMIL
ncbi:MAG: prepilin-type N-terminal cleavage/methylation domain-containing protein [Thermodesulfobacteriota bacterium]|nr:prepilin-type N-terminal cleavage/methylation domain-containing protein [Thermodesulfobacteriota bacterium]